MTKELTEYQKKVIRILNGEKVLTEKDHQKVDDYFMYHCSKEELDTHKYSSMQSAVYYQIKRNNLKRANELFVRMLEFFDDIPGTEKIQSASTVNWKKSFRERKLVLITDATEIEETEIDEKEVKRLVQLLRCHKKDVDQSKPSIVRAWKKLALYKGSINDLFQNRSSRYINWDESVKKLDFVLY